MSSNWKPEIRDYTVENDENCVLFSHACTAFVFVEDEVSYLHVIKSIHDDQCVWIMFAVIKI